MTRPSDALSVGSAQHAVMQGDGDGGSDRIGVASSSEKQHELETWRHEWIEQQRLHQERLWQQHKQLGRAAKAQNETQEARPSNRYCRTKPNSTRFCMHSSSN